MKISCQRVSAEQIIYDYCTTILVLVVVHCGMNTFLYKHVTWITSSFFCSHAICIHIQTSRLANYFVSQPHTFLRLFYVLPGIFRDSPFIFPHLEIHICRHLEFILLTFFDYFLGFLSPPSSLSFSHHLRQECGPLLLAFACISEWDFENICRITFPQTCHNVRFSWFSWWRKKGRKTSLHSNILCCMAFGNRKSDKGNYVLQYH